MDNKKFGAFIVKLRKEKGLTQKELADKIFVTDKAVSKWERGLSFPDIELLIPIAEIFSVSVLELLKGERNNQDKACNELNENEIVIEILKTSKDIEYNKYKIPRWFKILICIILIWSSMFFVDYICVTKHFKEPLFSFTIKSKKIKNEDADYIEKNFVGLFYSSYTRGQNNNKGEYIIHYGEINIGSFKVKDFYKGVTE